MATPTAKEMFDPEVIAEMRRQFDAADRNGNGELDAEEACRCFVQGLAQPGESEEELRRTADNLRNQMDADRSGTISFDEYCFRFGRRYQQEVARRRRASAGTPPTNAAPTSAEPSADALKQEREALQREREALRREREEMERERTKGPPKETPNTDASSAGAEPGRLAPGTRVTIQGLRGSAELNGRRGAILRFEPSNGRYIVELAGGGGQKSLRLENLSTAESGGSDAWAGFVGRAKTAFREGSARLQVWLAGYEWWQILLGVAVVVLVVGAYLQNQARYASRAQAARGGGSSSSSYSNSYSSSTGTRPSYGGEGASSEGFQDDINDGFDSYSEPGRGQQHGSSGYRQRAGRGRRAYEDYDDSDHYDHGYGGGGGGGLLSNLDQTTTLLIVCGIGYMCWKGIIPVHKMSFFQIYMLWQMLEPLLLGGGRRRRGGFSPFGMGMGMRRGMFF